MPYPTKMVSALTGVSAHQLRRLRRKGVIAPSRGRDGEYLYSFDDLLVLRIFAKLRPYISAQKNR
ncbi:MerR family transcriptional regulator [Bifidobacterium simiiventris]|uniref:MerR family transcriptional regulator n=1 Tax=Bifidobacterium simiiventris TaxID=2834434 RepID=UPI001C578302|nr:MerR family transcriptional regulator [Bifidobacterium simiiventris]